MRYARLRLLLPPEAEDRLVAELAERGTLGLEVRPGADGRLSVDAWFPHPPPDDLASPRSPLWAGIGAELAAVEEIGDEDWMAAWRQRARPVEVGRRLLVDPGEPGAGCPAAERARRTGRRLLRLPARRAFGTGSHASTRLAVELLDEVDLAGRRVLDVGTGTGVLAFAALLGGSRFVAGVEIDPTAAFLAGENRALNDLWPSLVAGTLACLADEPRFDVVAANLVAERLEPELPAMVARLAAGGELVASGLLAAARGSFLAGSRRLGLEPVAERREGEWIAYRMQLRFSS